MLVIGSAMPALADTGNGSLNELASLNPGTSVTELRDSLGEFAQDEGISLDEAVNRALSESKASVKEQNRPALWLNEALLRPPAVVEAAVRSP